jgi:hypothetical protein
MLTSWVPREALNSSRYGWCWKKHVVGEDLDLQLDAFLGQGRFDELEELRVRHGGGRHADLAGVGGGGGEGRSGGQGGQQFLHVQLLVGYGAGFDGWPVARCSRWCEWVTCARSG